MQSNLGIIIQREYTEHVAKKSFIITTLLMPVFMLLMMAAPTLIAMFSTPTQRTYAVIDNSGIVMPELESRAADVDYLTLEAMPDSLAAVLADERFDGVLFIGANVVDNPRNVSLYTRGASSIDVEGIMRRAIESAVEEQRLRRYEISNLREILDEIEVDVNLATVSITSDGEEGESTSSMMSFAIGLFSTFVLYMFLLMYGQMVLTSIIEEKNNRVLELIVSSVKPIHLMLGKIIGVGLVAVTQVVIWTVLVALMSAYLLPAILPAELASEVASYNAGTLDTAAVSTDLDLLQVLALLGSVGYVLRLFGFILLFLVGGFLLYASIFAAIGSAVDNIQDASQLQSFAIVPILIAFVCSMTVATDPNTPLAFWLSMIPFTSPMVMLARIPFDIPSWEIWVSVVVLFASFVAMAWVAAKIYRVGIFMYGKKPTIKELIRWTRYK